jgi:hypothetical protein
MFQFTENYGATPATMSTPGSRVTAAGLTVMLIFVSAGINFSAGGFSLLLCFVGVLVGANLLAAGVPMADGPAPNPIVPVVFGGARALAAFMRRNTAGVGLVMASFAFTVVSGEEDPLLCFGMFTLLLLGLTLINIGIDS